MSSLGPAAVVLHPHVQAGARDLCAWLPECGFSNASRKENGVAQTTSDSVMHVSAPSPYLSSQSAVGKMFGFLSHTELVKFGEHYKCD